MITNDFNQHQQDLWICYIFAANETLNTRDNDQKNFFIFDLFDSLRAVIRTRIKRLLFQGFYKRTGAPEEQAICPRQVQLRFCKPSDAFPQWKYRHDC